MKSTVAEAGWRITVDTGGTFTDIVVADTENRLTIGKAPTTPDRIFNGMRAALENVADQLAMPLGELMEAADVLIYGTTCATNAIVTGQIAKTALLTTRGFPDVLVLREGGKFNPHDFSMPYPKPYLPRRHTFQITERVNAEGDIVTRLDETEARATLGELGRRGFESIAVSLLWSVANAAHEFRLGELIEELLPGIPYTLSHQLNPILREYRRASSTAIDASIKPLMQSHLRQMQSDLHEAGFAGEILVSTTIGGCLDIDNVTARPINTVRSGPAMAPVAGRRYGDTELAAGTVLVIDTGGTTFDVSLVRDGAIVTTQETWIGERFTGHMLGVPAVDARSVGAGGGSIAWLDDARLLRVGPQSAGAVPGPACYAQGGTQPTVTDAALVLGYIDPEYFLGGRMRLDRSAAVRAMVSIADPLALSVEAAAFSVLAVANETMINAIKEITISEGVDPREAVLIAGGGAAGLNILQIAQELGTRAVLFPSTASVLSASGMQFVDIQIEQSVSAPTRSGSFDRDSVNAALDAISQDLSHKSAPLLQRGLSQGPIVFRVDAHYAAQVWEIDVTLPSKSFDSDTDVDALIEAFHANHKRIFSPSVRRPHGATPGSMPRGLRVRP
jgi:N-methylhydantoinase A